MRVRVDTALREMNIQSFIRFVSTGTVAHILFVRREYTDRVNLVRRPLQKRDLFGIIIIRTNQFSH